MDFLPRFFQAVAKARGKKREEVEVPAPIAEGPPPERVILPPAPAVIPRWRLERESAKASPALPEIPAGEVTLILDDVLPRVPTHALKEGMHDPDLPLNFHASDFRSSLARGRPTVVLSQLSARYPEIFTQPASPAEDTEVILPVQKVLRQLERARLEAAAMPLPPVPALYAATIPPPAMLKRPEAVAKVEASVPEPAAPEEEPALPKAEPAAPREEERLVAPPIRITPVPPHIRAPSLAGGAAPETQQKEEKAEREPAVEVSSEADAVSGAMRAEIRSEGAPASGAAESARTVALSESSSQVELPPEFFLIEQEPLQAIFMTDEELDLPRISELSASLPGITGCMILAGEHLTQGGEKPAGLDAATLRELSQKVSTTIAGFSDRLPAEPNFTLYGGNRALSVFSRPELCLCVVHAPRGFLPGVRERLAAVADHLAQSLCSHQDKPELPR